MSATLLMRAGGSDPKGFVRAGRDVFFTAGDGTGARQLRALPVRPQGQCDGALTLRVRAP